MRRCVFTTFTNLYRLSKLNYVTSRFVISDHAFPYHYGPCWLENAFVMGSEKFSDTTWFENTRLLVPPINRIIKTKCERWRFLVILIKSFIGDFVSGLILWVASIEMWRQTNKVHKGRWSEKCKWNLVSLKRVYKVHNFDLHYLHYLHIEFEFPFISLNYVLPKFIPKPDDYPSSSPTHDSRIPATCCTTSTSAISSTDFLRVLDPLMHRTCDLIISKESSVLM